MTRWNLTITAVAILAALALACQSESLDEAADDSAAAVAEEPAVETVAAEPQAAEETAAPVVPEEPEPQEKPADKTAAAGKPAVPHDEVVFAANAFPPTVSDSDYHQGAWYKDDCLRCHETGVQDATVIRHENMPPILLQAKCRSCHVLIRGQDPVVTTPSKEEDGFAAFAFPPMIPASVSHRDAWFNDTCLMCHEDGVRGAPVVKHEDMPPVLLKAKCRSCHVQVRSAVVKER